MARFFPVAGWSDNRNDFGASRGGGSRPHDGVDIMASEGTPLVAVDGGTVYFGSDPLGGNVANLYADDGYHYYYAHLSSFAGGGPRRVEAGETIGYVGRTGNAKNTPAHVHFEAHPCPRGQRCAVNPTPIISGLPRADQVPSPSSGRGVSATPLRALAIAGIAGAALWWYLDRRGAERTVRRYIPSLPRW